ncbi:MAG: biopolymer transporter ExbD [Candidatus Eremiobacteraeota bacterium]|nr:biopolymer transporter ExbD [Candidatus Eremiobacteraeota bacterium]
MSIVHRIDDDVMAEINITPFTDVLLVLLIIFMILAAVMAPPGFQKRFEPPSAQPPPRARSIHQIEIDVSRTNRVTIDGVTCSSATLYALVARAVASHTGRPGYTRHIALLADKDASYDTIIKILDAARQAHDDDVGFVTY